MLNIKYKAELSDDPSMNYKYIRLNEDVGALKTTLARLLLKHRETEAILYGEEFARILTGKPMKDVVGSRYFVHTNSSYHCFYFNYLWSDTMKVKNRIKAWKKIVERKNCFSFSSVKTQKIARASRKELDSLNECAFDIETGGNSGIRCLSLCFNNSLYGKQVMIIDGEDLNSHLEKRMELARFFSRKDIKFIAHYGIHDVSVLMKVLRVPHFDIYQDTIWLDQRYEMEYKNLGYLSNVYLGTPEYKSMLDEANKTKDKGKLFTYCGYDSECTYELSRLVKFKDMRTYNQISHQICCPRKFEDKDCLFTKYPELKGKTKAELRKSVSLIDPRDIHLLQKATGNKKNEAKITIHGLDGWHVEVPDNFEYNKPIWVKFSEKTSACADFLQATQQLIIYDELNNSNVNMCEHVCEHVCEEDLPTGKCFLEVLDKVCFLGKVWEARFNSPEVSVYRTANEISPVFGIADWDIDKEDILISNNVVCVSMKEKEGWVKFPGLTQGLKELLNAH